MLSLFVSYEWFILKRQRKPVENTRVWEIANYLYIIFYILRSPCNWGRKWNTYDYQENEIYPVPEGVGVLHVIHYVRPSFQANYLQIDTIALLSVTAKWRQTMWQAKSINTLKYYQVITKWRYKVCYGWIFVKKLIQGSHATNALKGNNVANEALYIFTI